MPSLSASADPFVPMTDLLPVKYYFEQYKFLKTLESKAMHDPALLSKIKVAVIQLINEMDFSSTGSIDTPAKNIHINSSIQKSTNVSICSPNLPVPIYTDSFSSSLTPRQLKRKLRASTFRTKQNSIVSLEPTITRKLKQSVPRQPADPKYNNFFKYLDLVDSGIIKLPDISRLSPPISTKSISNSVSPLSNTTISSSIASQTLLSCASYASSSILSFPSRKPPCFKLSPTTPVSFSHLPSILIPASAKSIPILVSDNPDILCDVAPVSISNIDSASNSKFDTNLSSAVLNTLSNYLSSIIEETTMHAEQLKMSAEDVHLPSTKILYALESKSISFCRSCQWCSFCGLFEHTNPCELICPDCVSTPHPFFKCPQLHQYMLTSDSNNRKWYKDISKIIRQQFTGDPRLHRPAVIPSSH